MQEIEIYWWTLDGVRLELSPSKVIAPPGTEIQFVCKYHSHEELKIVIREVGKPLIFRNSDLYSSCHFGAQKQFHTRVSSVPTVIQCYVKNMDDYIVGVIISRIYPGLKYPKILLYVQMSTKRLLEVLLVLVFFIFRERVKIWFFFIANAISSTENNYWNYY